MVGLTHVAFRELIRSYLPHDVNALLFTEMLSSRRLPSERIDTATALRCAPGESFFVPQLLGNEERFIAPSIAKLMTQNPWGIDINMGCPTTHTLKHNWGVLLMGDAEYAAEVVRIAKRHSPIPVSVKLRAGLGDAIDVEYLKRFTGILEAAGADWMSIHCRPQGKQHRGEADWTAVAEVAKTRAIPVVANGDIQTADDAIRLTEEFGVDGAMIGRAATARPWILGQIAVRLGADASGLSIPQTAQEESREYFRALYKFLGYLELFFEESYALRKFHFFVANGMHWFLFGHSFWKATMKAKTIEQAKAIVMDYGEKHEHPYGARVTFN